MKPQELPVIAQLDLDLKQPNKTKKVILLNNGLLHSTPSGNLDQTEPRNFRTFDTNNKPRPLKFDCSPNQKPSPVSNDVPQFDRKMNYNQLFWKMYIENELVVSEMKQYIAKSKEIITKISSLEHECQELEKNLQSNTKRETKKKNRRTANEIQKSFLCPYQNCNKNYGSDVSLNLHIKLKHNGGNKTEREKLARTIFLAKMNGEDGPEVNLNLPPGFLDNMNKAKVLKEKVNKKDKNLTEHSNSIDDLHLGKAEESKPVEVQENVDKQSVSDSHSVETNSETPQKDRENFQDFSTKTASLLTSLITTK